MASTTFSNVMYNTNVGQAEPAFKNGVSGLPGLRIEHKSLSSKSHSAGKDDHESNGVVESPLPPTTCEAPKRKRTSSTDDFEERPDDSLQASMRDRTSIYDEIQKLLARNANDSDEELNVPKRRRLDENLEQGSNLEGNDNLEQGEQHDILPIIDRKWTHLPSPAPSGPAIDISNATEVSYRNSGKEFKEKRRLEYRNKHSQVGYNVRGKLGLPEVESETVLTSTDDQDLDWMKPEILVVEEPGSDRHTRGTDTKKHDSNGIASRSTSNPTPESKESKSCLDVRLLAACLGENYGPCHYFD